MIALRPTNEAGHALAQIVDEPGVLSAWDLAHRIWPCPFTGPVKGSQDWRRRVTWRTDAATRMTRLLSRVAEHRVLLPATHYRLLDDPGEEEAIERVHVEGVRTRSAVFVDLADYLPRVEMRPTTLRDRILVIVREGPIRPRDLARRLGRREELSGADKRAVEGMVEEGVLSGPGMWWPAERGVEVVARWYARVEA